MSGAESQASTSAQSAIANSDDDDGGPEITTESEYLSYCSYGRKERVLMVKCPICEAELIDSETGEYIENPGTHLRREDHDWAALHGARRRREEAAGDADSSNGNHTLQAFGAFVTDDLGRIQDEQ